MRRVFRFCLFAFLLAAACADDTAPDAARCVSGATRRCPCAGAGTGVQLCQDDGSFGRCNGCTASGGSGGASVGGASGSSAAGQAGTVSTGGGKAGATNVGGAGGSTAGASGTAGDPAGASGKGGDAAAGTGGTGGSGTSGSGGTAGSGPTPIVYGQGDCLSGDPPVNDTESCDDGAFQPAAGVAYVLLCVNQNGGVAYVATNTGPPDTDGTPRCQGWEHSTPPQAPAPAYLAKLDCLAGGPTTLAVDLSAHIGKTIYYGAHLAPNGTGQNTAACLAGSKEPPSPACTGDAHCSNGAVDCGEAGLDCGGGCAACPPVGTYVYTDCKTQEAPSNGSEDCDDTSMQVQAPGTQYVLVCFSHAGGTAYVSTNTGPVQSDGHARCQGWEEKGQSAPEYLQYVTKTTCDTDQKTVPLDLSAYVGQNLHMGTHLAPDGSGHGTVACIALKK